MLHRTVICSFRIISGILVFATEGCLPIPRTVIVSPPIVGSYQRSDGAPLTGVQLFVAPYEDTDSLCVNALASTTTDSSGRFELPVVKRRVAFIALIPDQYACYQLCAGRPDSSRIYYACTNPFRTFQQLLTCMETLQLPSQNSIGILCDRKEKKAAAWLAPTSSA
jgi:hypothetical protein